VVRGKGGAPFRGLPGGAPTSLIFTLEKDEIASRRPEGGGKQKKRGLYHLIGGFEQARKKRMTGSRRKGRPCSVKSTRPDIRKGGKRLFSHHYSYRKGRKNRLNEDGKEEALDS